MTIHGTPLWAIRNKIEQTAKREDRYIARRKIYKSKTMEEKMKDPNYVAAVEFNQKHGLGTKGCKLLGGYCRGANKIKGRRPPRKVKVTLPEIKMPLAED